MKETTFFPPTAENSLTKNIGIEGGQSDDQEFIFEGFKVCEENAPSGYKIARFYHQEGQEGKEGKEIGMIEYANYQDGVVIGITQSNKEGINLGQKMIDYLLKRYNSVYTGKEGEHMSFPFAHLLFKMRESGNYNITNTDEDAGINRAFGLKRIKGKSIVDTSFHYKITKSEEGKEVVAKKSRFKMSLPPKGDMWGV
ncbi:MAG: hypothetical protein PHU73_04275 [Patescibacteria group bacterium]|nr:hypothetical protein [Patescibacteria group bacterium]